MGEEREAVCSASQLSGFRVKGGRSSRDDEELGIRSQSRRPSCHRGDFIMRVWTEIAGGSQGEVAGHV